MPIFLSVLCGGLCGKLMFSIYNDKENEILTSNKIYLLLDESYDDYDSMKLSSAYDKFVYFKDDGKYNTVVGMTKNKDNIDKIKSVYNKDLVVEEYLLSDNDINNEIDECDKRIEDTDDNDEIKNVIVDMINIYKDKEDVKMAKIS